MIAALTVIALLGLAFILCAALAIVAVCYAIAADDARRFREKLDLEDDDGGALRASSSTGDNHVIRPVSWVQIPPCPDPHYQHSRKS